MFGVKMEQTTITFYSELKKVCPPAIRPDLDFIIASPCGFMLHGW
jgi:hypothetical protein